MTTTVSHPALLATTHKLSGQSSAAASWLGRMATAFRVAVEVIAESREEERKAHARLPFTDW